MAKRRPSGDGMVRKCDDGRWEGRVVVGYDDKGLPITKNVLAKTKDECVDNSRWMFPSPTKDDSTLDPATVQKRLQTILGHAGCRKVRFRDLRHLFVTTALEKGMDVKTLSAIVGHISAKTTLNVYTHVSDAMQRTAASKIDRGIGGHETTPESENIPAQTPGPAFQPYKGKIRKPGTGCVTQINDHLWEGRYSPKVNGKRMARNVHAQTEAECEEKLAAPIV